ncbi:T9SS type A sorting domain-containing protein [Gillisia sp. JM1]|uniref:T9SS type A sorting domain-containing protein n=1 Tax=Gillisia sp. JM1 TaxID=1283286 RepID=UPI0003FAD78F|nr:T9SS type A sorting domain-containing protein [Gillisia sp. JM1]
MERTLLSTIFLFVLSFNTFSFDLNCPIVANSSQSLCSSEGTGNNFHKPRISDLIASDGGAGIAWFESSSSLIPLENSHLLESGKQYYADNASGSCGSRIAVSVTINDAPNAGSTTFASLCSNSAPVDLLTLYKPSILGPPDSGGVLSPALVSGTTVFDPAIDKAGQYRYIVESTSGLCPTDYSFIYVSIKPAANAGEDASTAISISDSQVDLFTILGGSPDSGGTWSPSLLSGSGIFDPAQDNFGDYTYTVFSTNTCNDSAVVTISMVSDPLPATCPIVANSSQSLCSSEGTGNNFHKPRISDLVASDGGAGIAWFESSSSLIPLENSHLLESGKQYYADNASGSCGSRIALSVTINDAPNAGATTFASLCSNSAPVDLLTLYKPSILGPPDSGGVFSPALVSGTTVFDPAIDKAGQYRYIVESTSGLCPTDYSFIYVSIKPAANAGEDASTAISISDSQVDLFTILGGSLDSGGTWSPSLLSGSGIFDPAQDKFGDYTYTVFSTNTCNDSAVVTISMVSDPLPATCPIVANSSQSLCSSEGTGNNFHKPRISDLVASDGGAGIAWFESSSSLIPLENSHLLESGKQYYADNASGSCGSRIALSVTINDAPNAGATTFASLCSNSAPVDLLTLYKPSILGPPDSGGVFSPALVSGTTVFDPAIDKAGQYRYIVESTSGLCPTDYSFIYIDIENCVTKFADNKEVAIFPNPSYGVFEVKKLSEIKVDLIQVYDFTGKKIKEFKFSEEQELPMMDLSSFNSGMYFAEIKTSKGTIIKKLIKK